MPPTVVAASYAVAIGYVLVDTTDKFMRARAGKFFCMHWLCPQHADPSVPSLSVKQTVGACHGLGL